MRFDGSAPQHSMGVRRYILDLNTGHGAILHALALDHKEWYRTSLGRFASDAAQDARTLSASAVGVPAAAV